METFLIFLGVPIALFGFIIFAAVHRARAKRTMQRAAEKYINS